MPKTKLRAFTLKANKRLLRSLITPVQIIVPSAYNACTAQALWDTGATRSGISNVLAQKLELVPTGEIKVDTATGTAIQNTYVVEIVLPNQIIIQEISATEFTASSNDIDAIIGMDIITLGDFSITNHHQTCMSFRIPSCHELDYSITHT